MRTRHKRLLHRRHRTLQGYVKSQDGDNTPRMHPYTSQKYLITLYGKRTWNRTAINQLDSSHAGVEKDPHYGGTEVY